MRATGSGVHLWTLTGHNSLTLYWEIGRISERYSLWRYKLLFSTLKELSNSIFSKRKTNSHFWSLMKVRTWISLFRRSRQLFLSATRCITVGMTHWNNSTRLRSYCSQEDPNWHSKKKWCIWRKKKWKMKYCKLRQIKAFWNYKSMSLRCSLRKYSDSGNILNFLTDFNRQWKWVVGCRYASAWLTILAVRQSTSCRSIWIFPCSIGILKTTIKR